MRSGAGRLECLLAATCLQTFNEHVKSAGCLGGSVVSKPNEQRIGVGDGRFAKAEAGANLSTESFCSTRCQQLAITCRGRRVELLAQRINHSLLNCRFEPREPAAVTEEGQQHSEAEPRATVLGHRQGVVLGRQGPRHGWSCRTGAGRWSRIDPGQRLDQRSTLDAKVAAHGCLRHAIVQRSKNGIQLLADYHRRSPTHPAATPSRCQPCHHPLSGSVANPMKGRGGQAG